LFSFVVSKNIFVICSLDAKQIVWGINSSSPILILNSNEKHICWIFIRYKILLVIKFSEYTYGVQKNLIWVYCFEKGKKLALLREKLISVICWNNCIIFQCWNKVLFGFVAFVSIDLNCIDLQQTFASNWALLPSRSCFNRSINHCKS